MPWVLLAVVFVLTWAGSALLIDSWRRRPRRPTLAQRLQPFQPTIADEAERWLIRVRPGWYAWAHVNAGFLR